MQRRYPCSVPVDVRLSGRPIPISRGKAKYCGFGIKGLDGTSNVHQSGSA